ncbi:uncharacterized protein KY384_002005 [Bacidia gigantensis]|uniref:uncharacterized protein n=1 Tax=Bacidia gigantensis TaxID=2732470 RepID=UPI001D0530FD|nr:uncharacterized protein KY384_002005 [Bacidia gigantensis]KAG8533222.1 hypothetical protein KY384_002005 [Bacidia gigantensis]
MAQSLNVVALVSGGKDSFFSLLHCIKNGHKVIALANLHPPLPPPHKLDMNTTISSAGDVGSTPSFDDMNSFMYQTAGHNIVPLYADALGLPLYRAVITGTAVDSSKYYSPSSQEEGGDEIACLTELLNLVKASHPELSAVSSGAILSTYQRTRVESVAIRLGLVPLSFLWQYPVLPPPSPDGLIDDMAAVGFDVRLVKVSSGGLGPELLWCNLMDPAVRQKIQKAMGRFGGSLLGEGGEYETLVIDGPSPVWKKRIKVDDIDMQMKTEDGSGSGMVTFGPAAGRTVSKSSVNHRDAINEVREIPLWDSQFLQLLRIETTSENSQSGHNSCAKSFKSEEWDGGDWTIKPVYMRAGSVLHMANLTFKENCSSASEQMEGINRIIQRELHQLDRSTCDIVFTTIILKSIDDDFTKVNNVYRHLFTEPNPPARVTFSTPLPRGLKVMLSLAINMGADGLPDCLHVQSRSYWAPANIGPYSQAITLPCGSGAALVYVAGQIPLVPATMESLHTIAALRSEDYMALFQHRACLALQHLWRIGVEMRVRWWTGAVAFVVGTAEVQFKAELAYRLWSKAHDPDLWLQDFGEDESFDVWDRTHSGSRSFIPSRDDRKSLPDHETLVPDSIQAPVPALLVVQVDALPRECDIEWQSIGVATSEVKFTHINTSGTEAISCSMPAAETSVIHLYISKMQMKENDILLSDIISKASIQCLEQLGLSDQISRHLTSVYSPWAAELSSINAQVIPCHRVWGPRGLEVHELAAGVVIHVGPQYGQIGTETIASHDRFDGIITLWFDERDDE